MVWPRPQSEGRVQARDVWFLPKPLDFAELIAFLDTVLERPDGTSEDAPPGLDELAVAS